MLPEQRHRFHLLQIINEHGIHLRRDSLYYPPIPIISPTTILNLPINSFYPTNTMLVLTSDNSLSLFHTPLPSSCSLLCGSYLKLLCGAISAVYLCTFSRDFHECWNISFSLWSFICVIWWPLHFFGKNYKFHLKNPLYTYLCMCVDIWLFIYISFEERLGVES